MKSETADAHLARAASSAYGLRVESVRRVPGLLAFWDFVLREHGVQGTGRFLAHTATGDTHRYLLEPRNISRDYWHDGPPATLADFPLLGRGPFGQATFGDLYARHLAVTREKMTPFKRKSRIV